MRVIVAEPPLIEAIDAKFGVRGQPILFAFGDVIYNPAGGDVPPELMAHEAVHGERQLKLAGGVDAWWQRYLDDDMFRLEEELPAHHAEFLKLVELQRPQWRSERNLRRTMAAHVARKLAAPLYRFGKIVTVETAKKILLAA